MLLTLHVAFLQNSNCTKNKRCSCMNTHAHPHPHTPVCQELSNPDMHSCVGNVGTACEYVVRNPQLSGMGRWLARLTCSPLPPNPLTYTYICGQQATSVFLNNQNQRQTRFLLPFCVWAAAHAASMATIYHLRNRTSTINRRDKSRAKLQVYSNTCTWEVFLFLLWKK